MKERQYVRLKVRQVDSGKAPYGPVLDYEFYSNELSELGAECDAKKAAREAGFVHWVTADNYRVVL